MLQQQFLCLKKSIRNEHTLIQYTYKENIPTLKIPFVDDASVENVISVYCFIAFGILMPNDSKPNRIIVSE